MSVCTAYLQGYEVDDSKSDGSCLVAVAHDEVEPLSVTAGIGVIV